MNINKELLRTLLKELCEINGASGREENVREYETSAAAPYSPRAA